MLRAVLRWVRARIGGDGDDEQHDDETQFAPSDLDRSVRDAHGGGDAEQERKLAELQEQAQELDEHQRD
jgi:hypothetical protein